jgi:vesicle transport through interaction with t-SNAREs 1
MDTDIGTELFASYENDFNLIITDISSKVDGLTEQDGEAKKAAIRAADRALEEAEEIVLGPAPLHRAHIDCVLDRSNGDGSHEYT